MANQLMYKKQLCRIREMLNHVKQHVSDLEMEIERLEKVFEEDMKNIWLGD